MEGRSTVCVDTDLGSEPCSRVVSTTSGRWQGTARHQLLWTASCVSAQHLCTLVVRRRARHGSLAQALLSAAVTLCSLFPSRACLHLRFVFSWNHSTVDMTRPNNAQPAVAANAVPVASAAAMADGNSAAQVTDTDQKQAQPNKRKRAAEHEDVQPQPAASQDDKKKKKKNKEEEELKKQQAEPEQEEQEQQEDEPEDEVVDEEVDELEEEQEDEQKDQQEDEQEDEQEEDDQESGQEDDQEDEQVSPEELKVVDFKILRSRQVLQLELAYDKKLNGSPSPRQIPLRTIRTEVTIDDHIVMLRLVGGAALRLLFVVTGKAASKQVCKFKQQLHNHFRGEEVEGVEEVVKSLLYIWEDISQVQIRWTDNYTTVQPLSDVEDEKWYIRLVAAMRARRLLQKKAGTLGRVTEDIMIFNP